MSEYKKGIVYMNITKTFTITANKSTMRRFERFLCFLHYNDGHSGIFGMPFDGDGSDRLKCEPPPTKENRDQHVIAFSGPELEVAYDDCYIAYNIDRTRPTYKTENGKLIRIYPDGKEEICGKSYKM